MGELLCSDDYANFRAWVPRNVLSIGSTNPKNFVYYDWGPRKVAQEPIICLHAVAGSAEVFFLQILGLAPRGYRVISLEIPSYFSVEEFCQGFQSFLDTLGFKKVHIYGAGLGGFLGLCYASRNSEQVGSLVLTHSFCDTSAVRATFPVSSSVIPWLPEFVLRKFLLERLPKGRMERRVAAATEFVISHIRRCESEQLASRLVLTTVSEKVDKAALQYFSGRVTILSTLDWATGSSLAKQLHKELCEQFSQSRIALMKDGGDFPYLSRSEEVNIHLLVHLRRYAMPPATPLPLPPPARKKDGQPIFRVSKGSVPHLAANDNTGLFTGSDASKVSKLKELLPDYSEQFLEAALLVHHGIVEDTLQSILEGSLPNNFERSKEYVTPQSTTEENNSTPRQSSTEASAAEESLLLPPKQQSRGVVERNPLEYERPTGTAENTFDSTAASPPNALDEQTNQVFLQSHVAQGEVQPLNSGLPQGEGSSLTQPFLPGRVSEHNAFFQSNTYTNDPTSCPAAIDTSSMQTVDLNTQHGTDSSEWLSLQKNDYVNITVGQSKNDNQSSSEVVDPRLLEWKMSAYTSPSFQKAQP